MAEQSKLANEKNTGKEDVTIVSLVRCENYESEAVETAVRHAVDLLGGISSFVKPGDRVLLKPNLLSARLPERCVTTHPEAVRAVAKMALDVGGIPFIADSPGIEPFRRVAARTGMERVARETGIELLELTQPTLVSLPRDARFKKLEIASQALTADVVINLPKLKTHAQMLLTLGVKNLFGTIVAQRKAEWHYMAGVDRDTFASLLLDIYLAVKPALTILDGVWGMEGNGPANGKPRQINLIAAAVDALALDVSVCHLLGVRLRSFPIYREARKRGIGETDVDKISFRGESPQSLSVHDLQIPALDSMGVLPAIFDWFTKRYLVSKPVHVEANCAHCGECVEFCPAQAMELREKAMSFDYDRCIRCYCCQEICPENAIRFKSGLLVRFLNRFNR